MLPLSPANAEMPPSLEIKPIRRSEWDHYVSGEPWALLFHTSDWLDLLTRVYGTPWHPLGLHIGSQLVGLFPLLTRKLGPFHLAGSPLMLSIASTPYMGPLVASDLVPAALLALEGQQSRQKFDHIEIAFQQSLEETNTAINLGYRVETCQAVVLDLAKQTQEQVWSNLTPACRRAVQKARTSGVKIMVAEDDSFLAAYFDMCQEVYRRAGRSPHLSLDFYQAAWQALAHKGNLIVLQAIHENKPIAGGIFLLHGVTAYYLSGASYDWGLQFRPNNMIQWHFIQWAFSQGYRTYDLGGAVVPGITRFKLSFGGQFHTYMRLYRANSSLAKFGRATYQKLLPLWRKLNARQ